MQSVRRGYVASATAVRRVIRRCARSSPDLANHRAAEPRSPSDHPFCFRDHTRSISDHTLCIRNDRRWSADHAWCISDHARSIADHALSIADHDASFEDHARWMPKPWSTP